ncbi:hypothetical protein N0V93_009003 [Gnomoniopsis smithogilvyi]|uniref:Carotenoid cleavage dioxygenase 1 n=1 Tax=Gnomoniopsis smithogilvyi TaxID=1191159 RepID=A0A9W9CSE2_9PEZI|nr:hypothetical protein N0V93_009003 [Gnomoniopsis smithogilvyi]
MDDPQQQSSLRRTAADEQGDRAEAIKNLETEAYLDWPNEAGFDKLTEHRGPIELSVKGTIPLWASGSFFRNGPGGRKIENAKSTDGKTNDGIVLISHWFDGIAHLHRFDIVPSANGLVKVLYSSRRQADSFVKSVQEKGTVGDTISFGQKADPCIGIFGKAMSMFRSLDQGREAAKYDNLNVTVMPGPNIPALMSRKTSNRPEQEQTTSAAGHRGENGTKSSKTLWITSDTACYRVLDAATLEPLADICLHSDLHPVLKGAMSCAHIQTCPKTGDVFSYNIQPGPQAVYRIFRVSASTGKTDVLASISRLDLPPAYIHSFFLSERFVVLRVPTTHFGKMGLAVPWKGNLLEAIEPFDERKKCKWYFVDRVHGQGVVAEFETPAAFFFHSVNCWDEIAPAQGTAADAQQEAQFANVCCDVVDFPNTDFMHKFYYDVLMNTNGQTKAAYGSEAKMHKSMSSLVRWKFRVPLPTSSAAIKLNKKVKEIGKPEKLFAIPSPHSGELPTINPNYRTRQHRYVYSLPQTGRSTFLDTLVKTDTVTREILQWDNTKGHTPGEAIFVPRPGAVEEDDGVLLSVVLDGYSEKSYLVCLDAKTMQEMGRAEMDFAVGFGLHGMHSPDD